MSSRMVKWLLLASVLLIAFPVVAGASTSRIAGMGVQGDYVKDYTNIFGYPSCVSGVGNLVYGEFGQVTDYDYNYSEYFMTEDRAVGAVLGNLFDGKFGTFGFHMREYSPALGFGFQPYIGYDASENDEYIFGTGFETFDPYLDDNTPGETGYTPYWNGDGLLSQSYGTEALDLMWGKKFNKMSLGLRLNRSAYKATQSAGTAESTLEGYAPYDRNILGFGVGFGYEHSATLQSELGLLYQSRTFKWTNTDNDVWESDGGGAYLVSARAMWQWQPNVLVVPVGRIYSFNLDEKQTPDGGTAVKDEMKQSGWQFGVAGNWTLNQNDLFVAGVTFASNVWDHQGDPDLTTDDNKWTESLMPTMFASLEAKVNSWLTLRFGGRKGMFYSLKREYTANEGEGDVAVEQKESLSPFQFFSGAGVKLGTLQFDATLAQDFFHNPATYVTGSPNGENYYSPLFPKVTATYTF
jgi:hypothetical protein